MTWKPLVAIAILGGLATARADVSPEVYFKWRAEAQEAVIIEVESVSAKAMMGGVREVEVTARVVAAQRSKSGLKKGGKVVIRYENQDEVKEPPLGSSWAPMLKKGEFYPAFLNKAGAKAHFEPAAGGMSFEL